MKTCKSNSFVPDDKIHIAIKCCNLPNGFVINVGSSYIYKNDSHQVGKWNIIKKASKIN